MPTMDQMITVDLPDERTRAKVVKVISDTACLAEIAQYTTALKSHPYHKGDVVAVQLRKDAMGQQAWIAVKPGPALPAPETVASLADAAEDEAEEPEDAVDPKPVSRPAQQKPRLKSGGDGGKHSKRHAAAGSTRGREHRDGQRPREAR